MPRILNSVTLLLIAASIQLAQANMNASRTAIESEQLEQPRYEELTIGDEVIRYALLLPDSFDPGKTYPAALALPPGAQNEAMVEAGLSRYWEEGASERGWIIVSPINPKSAELFQSKNDPLPALLDHIRSRFRIEGEKFHLTGVSNGGRAAFIEALAHPERYASLTVLPGLLEEGTPAATVERLKDLPVTMYVGGEDAGWVRESERSLEMLNAAGVDATLIIREGEGHVVSITPDVLFDLLDTRRPDPADEDH